MNDKQVHIVVLRFSAMGDVAMTIPVLKALLEQHPNVKITMVSKPFFEPLFTDLPRLQFLKADVKNEYKGFLGLRRLSKTIASLKPDVIADLHNVLRSNVVLRFLKLKGLRGEQIDKGRTEKKALTKAENKTLQLLKSTHQRYAEVFERLGFPVKLSEVAPLPIPLPMASVELLLKTKTFKKVGIAPFAAHVGKQYPLSKMEEVIEKLAENHHVLLFGGGEKEAIALEAIEKVHENITSIVGKLSFKEEINLISQLDIMIAMDSGNGHIAANYGIPVITIWGVTHPYLGFKPFFQRDENQITPDLKQYPLIPTSVYGNKYPEGYLSCFETIAPKKIIDKIIEVLSCRQLKN